MEKRSILVCGQIHESGLEIFRTRSTFTVDLKPNLEPDQLAEIISEYDAVVVRSGTRVTHEVLANAERLRIIGRAGTGLDNIDVVEATKHGIVVMNTPGTNAVATAEHTISLIMAAHRHIPQAVTSMKAGLWEKKKFQGHEIFGRTLGILGLGKVGGLVARNAARGLHMEVIGFDPAMTPKAADQMGVRLVSLDDVLSKSDVISIHVPLNKSTRGLIGGSQFAKMKPGTIIVNCSRGGIIDEAALLDAIENGTVSTAALDVFESTIDSTLIQHPRVIATPHLGASTLEAQASVSKAICEQIVDFFENGIIRNAVNVPTIDESTKRKVGPYLDLAKRLGHFLGQYSPGVVEMEIEYSGEIASDIRPITSAALVGLLSVFEGSDVNLVNASSIALDRGIQVSETLVKEAESYGPSLEVRTKTRAGKVYSLQGALIRRIGFEPRIIGIGPFLTEAVPAGPMLIVSNTDKPGMIAGMSQCLAESSINIAQMNLSRDRVGGSALSIINIDTPAGEATLQRIRSIDGILSVTQVVLDA